MSTKPTKRQLQISDYMHDYLKENDNMPTAQQVADQYGFASCNASYDFFKALEKHKILERVKENMNQWRFVRRAVNV